jgi:metal-sulfur cluster biosynthetic enzyme
MAKKKVTKVANASGSVSKEAVIEALKNVFDPELPISVWDMGLIYDIGAKGNAVHVKMTLSSPGCPMHSMIARSVEDAVSRVKGVKKAIVEVVWEPPWSPERMSEEAKKILGMG